MDILISIIKFIVGAYFTLFIVYIFNLDMKLIKSLQPIADNYYDNIKRDRKL
ncbi:hypothetical protein [Tepidibacter sp. Z1-5]|uniref:hypothetical protein n=1 Tax=Tepidibacter sp. Z1-5 TaxID=3134138 RepID=UPI0030BB93AE